MGLLSGLFSGSNTSTFAPDQSTQDWLANWRASLQGIQSGSAAGLPDYSAVRENALKDFGFQRAAATTQAADLATKAGAFGGSGGETLQALMNRDIGMDESRTMAGLGLQENQDKWARAMQLMGLFGAAVPGGGHTLTNTQEGNGLGSILGLATTGAGLASGFGAPAALAGAAGGAPGGGFGSMGAPRFSVMGEGYNRGDYANRTPAWQWRGGGN